MPRHLSATQLARDLAVRDLTDPDEGPHGLQHLVAEATAALARRFDVEVRVCRGPRVVPVADNYDLLGFEPGAVTRDARYTRYVDDRHLLRSHASAMVPPALRALAADPAPDVLLVCPGVVYRRDAIDWQHTGTPHQLDLWRLTRRRRLGLADLDEMLDALLPALAPGRAWRQQPRRHPYTLGGRQVDVEADGRLVEVGECGLAHPEVLGRAGLEGWTGLALGVGLDRLFMLRKAIPDVRLLRSEDPRVAGQMLDLDPYRPVSSHPPVRRDLSLAVAADAGDEDLGDRVREALGPDADAVEEVTVLARSGWGELPEPARARLGLREGQANLLARLVLRRLERSLTDEEANVLRDRVFAAIHEGDGLLWASADPPERGARGGG